MLVSSIQLLLLLLLLNLQLLFTECHIASVLVRHQQEIGSTGKFIPLQLLWYAM